MGWLPSCSGCGSGGSKARLQCGTLRESCEPRAGSALAVSCQRVGPVAGQEVVGREPSGGFWLLEQVVPFSTRVLGWGCQPGNGDLQQLQSPEMASQLPVQRRSYKSKGQLWEGTKKTLAPHPCPWEGVCFHHWHPREQRHRAGWAPWSSQPWVNRWWQQRRNVGRAGLQRLGTAG